MAAIDTEASTPVDQLPHDNLGPTLLAVLWPCVALSAIILALRMYCKLTTGRGLWWDDYFLLASWTVLVVYVGMVTYGVVRLSYGARDWDFPPQNIPMILKMAAASYPLLLVSIIWSKTSFGATLLRLTTEWTRRVVWMLIISTNVFLGFTILIQYIKCTPIQSKWDITVKGKCWRPDAVTGYHIFSGTWSAAVDFAFVLVVWKLLWGVQIMGKEKLGIAVAMSMGILAGATSIVKTAQLHLVTSGSMYKSIPVMYWGPIETAATIIAASIPALRVLIRDAHRSAGESSRTSEGADLEMRTPSHGLAIIVNTERGDEGSEKSILGAAGRVIEMTKVSRDRGSRSEDC